MSYFQVGIQANRRYLDALAAAPLKGKGVAALDALCRSRTKQGRHVSRFNPLSPSDLNLFRAVLAGEYTIIGFRNADLASRLYPHPPATPQEAQRRRARISRLIAKLRGHGLVAKVPRHHLYRVTEHGHRANDRRPHHPRPQIPRHLSSCRITHQTRTTNGSRATFRP